MGMLRVMGTAAVAVAAVVSASGVAFGQTVGQTFHSGGVAYCEGCHTMHNSPQDFVNSFGTLAPQTRVLWNKCHLKD